MLEDDVRVVAEDLTHRASEAPHLLEARLFLVGGLVPFAHHALELVAVDEALRAELLDELSLLV